VSAREEAKLPCKQHLQLISCLYLLPSSPTRPSQSTHQLTLSLAEVPQKHRAAMSYARAASMSVVKPPACHQRNSAAFPCTSQKRLCLCCVCLTVLFVCMRVRVCLLCFYVPEAHLARMNSTMEWDDAWRAQHAFNDEGRGIGQQVTED
jgi:hypothetical protein